jgi:hypothetical protein
MTRLRPYWSVVVLAAFTVALIGAGFVAGNEFTGAGLAVLGATVTRAVDIKQERERLRIAALEARRRDLDETRRLLYLAYMAWPDLPRDLASTLVNALAHHGLRVSRIESLDHLMFPPTAEGDDSASEAALSWILNLIDVITDELDDKPVDGG